MKLLFALSAVLAAAAAAPQYFDTMDTISVFPSARLNLDSSTTTVVEGAKATLAGPSGTILADTGKIVKSTPEIGFDVAARSVVMPKMSIIPEWDTVGKVKVMPEWDSVAKLKIMPEWDSVAKLKVVPEWDSLAKVKVMPEWGVMPKWGTIDSGLLRSFPLFI